MSAGNGRSTCPHCGQKMPLQLNAQQLRVQSVEAVFERYGVEGTDRPDPRQIALWLKNWNDDAALISALRAIGERGDLTMPLGYVSKCLGTALRRGKRTEKRTAGESDRVLAEARERQGRMG